MALSTYAGLIAAIPAHMFNSTILTASLCADFVAMTEAEVNRALKVRSMVTRADAIIDGEYSAMPSDFMGEVSFRLDDSRRTKLKFLDPAAFDQRLDDYTDTGSPSYFTIIGREFRYLPTPADSYTAWLVYWAKIPPLSDSSQTNWLLDKHPDVYLYGCLMHAAAFLKNMDERSMYQDWFAAAVGQAQAADSVEGMGSALQMSVSGVV